MHWLTRHRLGLRPKEVKPPVPVIEDFETDFPLPAMPTAFWCGSQEKVELMRERIAASFAPCHPLDCERYVPRRLDDWDKRVFPW